MTLTCVTCAKAFTRDAAEQAKRDRKGIKFGPFCSKACVRASPTGPAFTRVCPCGKTFKPRGRKPTRLHCSRRCVTAHRKRMQEPPDVPCGECGQMTKSPRKTRVKFCSAECKNKAHAKRMRGAMNSNYKGDGQPYFSGLLAALQPLIRQRDGDCCAVCKAKPTARSLTVHHIDENPTNNVPENLIALCDGCHNTHHKSARPPSRLQRPQLQALAEQRTRSMTSTLAGTITSLLAAY